MKLNLKKSELKFRRFTFSLKLVRLDISKSGGWKDRSFGKEERKIEEEYGAWRRMESRAFRGICGGDGDEFFKYRRWLTI